MSHLHPASTMTQFHDVRQFLGAIETAVPFLRQRLFRVARLHNEHVGDKIARLNVVAAARTHDRVILMDVECGSLTGDPRRAGPVLARADALKAQIEQLCLQLGLRTCPGAIAA